jgi:hypothetical protein
LTDGGIYELYHVLKPPMATVNAGFGRYIELSDDQLIIGSQNSNILYVFDTLSLVIEDVILPPKLGGPTPGFGVPVDVYEDVMVVGARTSCRGLGCAIVYQNVDGDDWIFQGYVLDKSSSSSELGISVSVGDGIIAVSPKNSNIYGNQGQGSATIYEYSYSSTGIDLSYNSTIAIDNGEAGDFFGKRLSIDNGNLYSTALYDDNSNGVDAGSVYVIPLASIL